MNVEKEIKEWAYRIEVEVQGTKFVDNGIEKRAVSKTVKLDGNTIYSDTMMVAGTETDNSIPALFIEWAYMLHTRSIVSTKRSTRMSLDAREFWHKMQRRKDNTKFVGPFGAILRKIFRKRVK